MSKYEKLWHYIKEKKEEKYILSYDKINEILGFPIDHSFLTYKKGSVDYGYKVDKISSKEKKVYISKIN
jgi:hypothetical protein